MTKHLPFLLLILFTNTLLAQYSSVDNFPKAQLKAEFKNKKQQQTNKAPGIPCTIKILPEEFRMGGQL